MAMTAALDGLQQMHEPWPWPLAMAMARAMAPGAMMHEISSLGRGRDHGHGHGRREFRARATHIRVSILNLFFGKATLFYGCPFVGSARSRVPGSLWLEQRPTAPQKKTSNLKTFFLGAAVLLLPRALRRLGGRLARPGRQRFAGAPRHAALRAGPRRRAPLGGHAGAPRQAAGARPWRRRTAAARICGRAAAGGLARLAAPAGEPGRRRGRAPAGGGRSPVEEVHGCATRVAGCVCAKPCVFVETVGNRLATVVETVVFLWKPLETVRIREKKDLLLFNGFQRFPQKHNGFHNGCQTVSNGFHKNTRRSYTEPAPPPPPPVPTADSPYLRPVSFCPPSARLAPPASRSRNSRRLLLPPPVLFPPADPRVIRRSENIMLPPYLHGARFLQSEATPKTPGHAAVRGEDDEEEDDDAGRADGRADGNK